jgi:hypothetical protein
MGRILIIEPAVAHQRHFDALRWVMARYLPAILVGIFLAPVASLFIPQLIAQSHAGQVTTSGLILNLDANDINSINGAGATTWKDLSGYGYDATSLQARAQRRIHTQLHHSLWQLTATNTESILRILKMAPPALR